MSSGFLGGLLLGCDLPLDVIHRKHAFLPILNEAHIRGYAAEKAALDVLGALVTLVSDDVHRFQPQILSAHFDALEDLPAVAGAVRDVEIGDHVAGCVYHGLNVVAGLDSALLGGHHGAFGVGEGHGASTGALQLLDAP